MGHVHLHAGERGQIPGPIPVYTGPATHRSLVFQYIQRVGAMITTPI